MTLPTLLVLLAVPADAPAQHVDAAAADEAARREAVAALAPKKARRLTVTAGGAEAEQHAEPLLRWSNPSAGSVYGEVFVWSRQGRPAALASIYRWYHPYTQSTLEVVSLSAVEVSAREGDKLLWESPPRGIAFRELGATAAPADSAAARLRQMRTLARRFEAELVDQRGGEGVERELRLLNQPIHRYESPPNRIVDGALFAFVEGTDPEAWLLIEAVETDVGGSWQYALARMNSDALLIRLDGAEAIRWDKLHEPWKQRRAHYTLDMFLPEDLDRDAPSTSNR